MQCGGKGHSARGHCQDGKGKGIDGGKDGGKGYGKPSGKGKGRDGQQKGYGEPWGKGNSNGYGKPWGMGKGKGKRQMSCFDEALYATMEDGDCDRSYYDTETWWSQELYKFLFARRNNKLKGTCDEYQGRV